jgi:hypothetical protein
VHLTLKRTGFGLNATLGELSVDGVFECYTLEDFVRAPAAPKVFGETAIPTGTYPVTIERSPRFSALAGHDVLTPRLHNVPGFDGVLIHPGNGPEDTEGCILVGRAKVGPARIGESRKAYDALFLKLFAAHDRGEAITISIER